MKSKSIVAVIALAQGTSAVLRRFFAFALILLFACFSSAAHGEGAWSGWTALEYRHFAHAPADPRQHDNYFSLAVQPQFVHALDGARDSIRFTPFLRAAQHDSSRTHVDIRELLWINVSDRAEWRLGIHKVFWGVTESQHLVDIVNQTDAVEGLDSEDKLGQPMVNVALTRGWGTLDLFVMPYFRERTFPGAEGRLRSLPPVDTTQAVYESSRQHRHVDFAFRWAKAWAGIDAGLSYFTGTSRDPRFVPGVDDNGTLALIPHYDLINQVGLDASVARGAWLWKLESMSRSDRVDRYYAATAGLEYTFSGIFDGADVGLLFEYSYDQRGNNSPSPLQDDVLLGMRIALNDTQNSELLATILQDRRTDERAFNIEASRRLGRAWKLGVEVRLFEGIEQSSALYSLRQDDYLQVDVGWYF